MRIFKLLLSGVLPLLASSVSAQQLIHYWNFNTATSATTLLTPNTAVVTGASITHVAGGISVVDYANGVNQNFNVSNLNARNSDTWGNHLRFNDPIGGQLVFALPTTGYENPIIKFTTRRSGSGAGTQTWEYTTDGTTYKPLITVTVLDADPVLTTFNLTDSTGVDNNPNFKLRVSFAQGAGGLVGNNRFDNFTVDASLMPVLVHYWNFNNNTTLAALVTPTVSLVTGASISHVAGGTSLIDFANGTSQNFNVSNFNARNSDASGTHFRFNEPIGGQLVFALPTTGYENPIIKFTTRRSGSGAGTQTWEYTTNGTTYATFAIVSPLEADPQLHTFNFSDSAGVNNNANFKLRVSFTAGAGGIGGNNRFDNFTLDANSLGGGDVIPPATVFSPVSATQNVAVNVNPTITFNENVRLLNNTAITSANAAALVELRLNNATGTVVPFTTTFAANVITIIPTTALANNQQYYVALKASTIEDVADNAIVAVQSSTFKTMSIQTVFTAGDMVFVGYRMNATNADDEVAILTLVDILPGTFINFTDAKYTSNAQPQCPGGIVWTAPVAGCVPAGTVITIKTEALTTNLGTVTGAGFGLSSGGDQVIVYTGTATVPNYVTALTANNWATTNTMCSGSNSLKPATLTDGTTSFNASMVPGNVGGLSVNAYYNGTQAGTITALKAAILNPANWLSAGAGTAPQTWPSFNFPAPPTVTNASILTSKSIRLIFNNDLDAATASNIANYTGIAGLNTATVTNNGTAIDTVVLTYSTPFANGNSYTLNVNNISNTASKVMACSYSYAFTYTTTISFASNFVVTNEGVGTLNFSVNVVNPSSGYVDLVVMGYPHSTATAADYTLATQKLLITGSTTAINVAIPIIDDKNVEQAAEYFVVKLSKPVGAMITGDTLATIYIKDNDQAGFDTGNIKLQYVGSFDPSGSNSSTCEVVAYDSASKRLFTTSAIAGFLDIVDFSDPKALKVIKSIDIKPWGGLTSVATKNGIVAVASPNANEQLNGSVVFFDIDGVYKKEVTVGALPDMITFTPDGSKVLTANEGQPNAAYTVDPEGSVSVIDISSGVANINQSNVNTIYFTSLNAIEAVYIKQGIRKLKATSTLSQDMEPEYITVSANSKTAWVTIQENNAIAEIDLASGTLTSVWPMGTKNASLPGNGFDASDNNNQILIANWPVKSFYIPDAIANYNVNGVNYLITANEGDEKEYAGLTERTTVGAATYKLDSASFPNAAMLKLNHNLGRMRVTNLNGDIDKDGDFDEIYCVGTRSFTIWNADTWTLVYDSGDDFERYTSTAPSIAPLFNSDHEDNSMKSRSRAKGPEPEGVTVANISGKTYAFISLERIGGVMVYDVTDPANAKFVDYKNSRSVSAYTGDHGPETMVFINAATPNGKAHLVVANEISGTLTVFEVVEATTPPVNGVNDAASSIVSFNVFPNPTNKSTVYFNRIADVTVTDMAGRVVYQAEQALKLDVTNYVSGVYLVHTSDGASVKLVVTK